MSYQYDRFAAIESAVSRISQSMSDFELQQTKEFVLDLAKQGRHDAAKDEGNEQTKAG